MRIACQEQLLPGGTLPEKFEFALSAGFAGIELRGKGDNGFAERLPELRAAARSGVVMPTVCVDMRHFIGDFDERKRRDALIQMRSQLSVIAELGGLGAVTPASWGMFSLRLPPFVPPRGAESDRAILTDVLGELGEHAAREGVWLALEPLNRYEDHMVNRLEQAVELIRTVERGPGARALGVCADLYHMNIEEDDLATAVKAAGRRIVHVQVNDSNRCQPGTGHLDFPSVMDALRACGYDGWLAFECRLRGDPEQALPEACRFLSRWL